MQNISYRPLAATELFKIQEIDRSEHIHEIYIHKQGKLILQVAVCVTGTFETEELKSMIAQQQKLLASGGKAIGAFDGNQLVGIITITSTRFGENSNYCKMDILYVSQQYRGQKIGFHLVQEGKKIALAFGANKLYISATPTKATVDFYLHLGAVLIQEPDPALFALEPLDIHLELSLY